MGRDHYKGIPKRLKVLTSTKISPNQPLRGDGVDFRGVKSADYLPASAFDLGGNTLKIYANSGGSDVTGDGSVTRPYRTLVRALKDAPVMFYNGDVEIDITNLGTEVLDPPRPGEIVNLNIGPVVSSTTLALNLESHSPGQGIIFPFRIKADPTITHTGLGSYTTSKDPTSQRRTRRCHQPQRDW